MSFSYDMKWKTFIKASSINDIHTGENLFAVVAFKGLLDVFFSDVVNNFLVYFGFFEFSLLF